MRRKRNANIEALLHEIESRGGMVGLSDETPDELAESFLRQVLECPICTAEAKRRRGRREH